MCDFSVIFVSKGIMTFWNQRVYAFCWTKNVNFDKNEMESNIENPTYSFREMNFRDKNEELKVKL